LKISSKNILKFEIKSIKDLNISSYNFKINSWFSDTKHKLGIKIGFNLPIYYDIKERIDKKWMEFYFLLSTQDFRLGVDQDLLKIDLNIFEEP